MTPENWKKCLILRDSAREIVVHTHSAEERKIQQNGPVLLRENLLLAKFRNITEKVGREIKDNIPTTE